MDLLKEFDRLQMNAIVCPLDCSMKLRLDEGALLQDPSVYKRLVEKLNFLPNTMPDIAFSVQHLSQFLQAPREPHMKAVVHVLRYIKGASALGILLKNNPIFDVLA